MRRRELSLMTLIFSGGLISYMDRAVFGVLAPLIQKDLAMDTAQLGYTLSCFSIGYTAAAYFGGHLADRFGARLVLSVSMFAWSMCCALTGAATSILALFVVRLAFGAFESPWISCSNKMLYDWFSPSRFVIAVGISSAGQPLGGIVAGPLVGILVAHFGWRMAFVGVGLLGLVWWVPWRLFSADEPPTRLAPLDSRAEVRSLEQPASSSRRAALFHPTVLATCCCFFSYGYLLYFYLSWFPTYLSQARGLSFSRMSLASAVPWAGGTLGLILGALLSGFLVRLFKNPLLVRKTIIMTGLTVAAIGVAIAPTVQSPSSAVALMAMAVFLMFLTGPNFWAIAMDVTPKEYVGAVGGFMVVIVNIAGVLAPLVTGLIVKSSGSFNTAFMAASCVVIAGVVILGLFAKPQTR